MTLVKHIIKFCKVDIQSLESHNFRARKGAKKQLNSQVCGRAEPGARQREHDPDQQGPQAAVGDPQEAVRGHYQPPPGLYRSADC